MADTSSSGAMTAALDGVRIVEVGNWIAGPFAAAFLADFGADVVKVESPQDHRRSQAATPVHDAVQFAALNRNKRSIALDIKSDQGWQILEELLAKSDVFITNVRSRRLGDLIPKIGAGTSRFERLVAVVVSGFGLTGPRCDQGAVDGIAQAFAGLTYVTGQPESPPVRAGFYVADYVSGWVAAVGATLALFEREKSGRGQVVDLGLYEGLLPMTIDALIQHVIEGSVRQRMGNYNPRISPRGVFLSRDGVWLEVSAGSDRLYELLMQCIGRPDLLEQGGLTTLEGRIAEHELLEGAIADWVAQRTCEEVRSALESISVPCAQLNTVKDLVDDPQARARGNFGEVCHARLGGIPLVMPLPRLTRTPGSVRTAGPDVGEHTDEVLREILSMSEDEVGKLRDASVVA